MKDKETSQPKISEKKFKIEEIISATSERTIRGVDFVENYGKIAYSLINSSDYKYDDEKSLAENIYAAFPQYKLREVTEKFKALMKSWENQGTTFINNAMNAKIMAMNAGIPQELTVKVREKEKEVNSKTENKTKPSSEDLCPTKGKTISSILGDMKITPGHMYDWKDKHFRD